MKTMLKLALLTLAGCVASEPQPAATRPPAAAAEPVLDAAAKARVEAEVRKLEPEFWLRRSRDGEAAANEWLRQQAQDISRREAARTAG
ncbi:hypothetical protein [Pseudogemmobacter humi]|uniref:Uncharacterized protein n=1 Tax=Pseudogemmobacter humi TaxID=2483812 RepID=A0A3P5WZE7_9RHOB|nr:hypothetical protein [Pseudogemmobacter humi]VDC20284.1 hypothetical protein XINFAN_00412 [Pseudogemmobacter humi]